MAIAKNWVPDRRDVIWIDCNPQAGREMKDVHPLLVLSPRSFNERTGIVIGLPMTTAAYNEGNPFAIRFSGARNRVSFILTHQPKSFDWRIQSAKSHPMKHVPEDVFTLACESLNQIIAISE
ncbi:MAG: type II toxin-antitoxin system PemK/MazF family toxin [Herminiimonas sp.]|nr:type II toxin-antitoxin system PemK/MazF family toxin [Herminiimonas sp.]